MLLTRKDYFKYLFLVYIMKKGTLGEGRSWRDPAIIDLNGLLDPPCEGVYPIDFSQDDVPNLLVDKDGIPMIDYANLGIHYNPWFIGHIALGRYTRWRYSNRDELRKDFLHLADWFCENVSRNKNKIYWFYNFDWFHHKAPWISGLSQAHGISVLLRAASITGKRIYAELAKGAVETMCCPLNKGGTATIEKDGSICFQESLILPSSYILNGHLFSCFAAWEAAQFFNNSHYNEAADKGFYFVQQRITDYDLGFWSCYSLMQKAGLADIASTHYHDVHIAQFTVAYAITKNPIFLEIATRFRDYQSKRLNILKAIWVKRIVKIIS